MSKIFVVGIGPGGLDEMTPKAHRAIEAAQVVAGYNTYIKLIEKILGGKKIIGRAMMQEVERCQLAIEEASAGSDVAVVSSGDAGVYGMAGLVLEMILDLPEKNRPQFEIIAGVSAVNAAAAILGAPLMNDFAIISLSDLMTPWELIKKRVLAAAQGDFVIALYNPKSKRRTTQLAEVQKILLAFREKNTPVGIVTNAGRDGETKIISTLENFIREEVNMFSLVIIGNSQTFIKENFMITPRGYKL
ncbi:MAG: precorrin-3B C(17)-methyltransferase [Quinella sp. 3Q1]|nr:precorrin-3B C(17)-methyltransferase [Quinella sp. 3Q1]MBR6889119.1 precorrin-3B C(17)-methyltransferase [Selenomonadaceae bacterium]